MNMPVRRFWTLHRCVDRLYAEEGIRLAQIGVGTQSMEGYKGLMDNLREQMGTVIEVDEHKRRMSETLDKVGLNELRSMGSLR